MSVQSTKPAFSDEEMGCIARQYYGITGTASHLPGDRDQNALISCANGDRFILKISNAAESFEIPDMENQAMNHLAESDIAKMIPAPLSDVSGRQIARHTNTEGNAFYIRMLSFLSGKPLADASPHSERLLRDIGSAFGVLTRELSSFDHSAAQRSLHWDLEKAFSVCAQHRDKINHPEKRTLLNLHVKRFEQNTLPLLGRLRKSIIHHDGNDYNILVTANNVRGQRISGILDFGDMVYTRTVYEPAVLCAYVMLHKNDPLGAAAQVIKGYHQNFPLSENELHVLFDLAAMRLCQSVCLSAHQSQENPDDAYLTVSEEPAWNLLEKLASINSRFTEYVFRDAAGLGPVPEEEDCTDWLQKNRNSMFPLLGKPVEASRTHVLDLSVSSPLCAKLPLPFDTDDFSGLIESEMRENNSDIGVGRYNEPRLLYTGEQFKSDALPRTVHLGIDLYAPAGTPLFAPMESKVHSIRNNDLDLDYGPTIILEHQTGEGKTFYTLYGHLSLESLNGLAPGVRIKKGRCFARIGAPPVNGNWPPHVHFQIINDMLDMRGDFPGVAEADRRRVWLSLCPDPNLILNIPETCFPKCQRTYQKLLSDRKKIMGPNLSLSYEKPIHMARGFMQYLYDAEGRAFLDAVNNVPAAGHCHPKIVKAVQNQASVLNTNTRYLHNTMLDYAEKLCAKLPEPLSVCYFVNSGSEANDLAIRLAMNFTGRKGIINLDHAYHGHLISLIAISPYKHSRPGGKGGPLHAETVLLPDLYRGVFRECDSNALDKYVADVSRAVRDLSARGFSPACMIAECMPGCGGQIMLPDSYLKNAFDIIRKEGGLCICDEVQTGFARAGSHFWAFETQDIVPDIVTLGKPIGNGFPLGAVITTRQIADAFDNGMEYFNTFGGNPVSCAAGLATLQVIEDENLQENARVTGSRLLSMLKALQDVHPCIGQVRGRGLFIGIELIKSKDLREPAERIAKYCAERMKENRILISTDGPDNNVLKIKPPLCFNPENAGRLADTLDSILSEDACKD